jgi:hypothetical protein
MTVFLRALALWIVLAPAAHARDLGERYNEAKYADCRKQAGPGDRSCDVYRLTRQQQPEYWPHKGKVAPPVWPEPPRRAVYRPRMTSREYFRALCDAEAGEFIYETVDRVEGVYQVSPRAYESDLALADRYVIEDPYGYVLANPQFRAKQYVQPPNGKYEFLELPAADAGQPFIIRYYRDLSANPGKRHHAFVDGRHVRLLDIVAMTRSSEIRSRYGFTWRGIERKSDRELGIAGGELIVVELATNRVLAVRRGFARSGIGRRGRAWWLSAERCPGDKRLAQAEHLFIERVLRPLARTQLDTPDPSAK